MKILKDVNVLGIVYSVQFKNNPKLTGEPDGSVWGYTDYVNAKIVLRKGITEQQQEKTFLHELMHAILHEMSQFEYCQDEILIGSLETGLYQVMKDNQLEG